MNSSSIIAYRKIVEKKSHIESIHQDSLTQKESKNSVLKFILTAHHARLIENHHLRLLSIFHSIPSKLNSTEKEALDLFLALFFMHQNQGHVRFSLDSKMNVLHNYLDELTESFEEFNLDPKSLSTDLNSALVNFIKNLGDKKIESLIGTDQSSKLPFLFQESNDSQYFYLQRSFHSEKVIRDLFGKRLLSSTPQQNKLGEFKSALVEVLDTYRLRSGESDESRYLMNDRQQVAVAMACICPTLLITGGPGTGKTSVVVQILRSLSRGTHLNVEDIAICAPTGRAAARLQESIANSVKPLKFYEPNEGLKNDLRLSQIEGNTLHRLLGYQPNEAKFKFNEAHQLPHKIVIVDEVSMVDIYQFSSLLKALKEGTQLILLGDRNQLPSVDSGSVLGDFTDEFYLDGYKTLSSESQLAVLDTLDLVDNSLDLVHHSKSIFKDHLVILTESHRSEKSILELAESINNENQNDCLNILLSNSLEIEWLEPSYQMPLIQWPVPQVNSQGIKRCEPSGVRLIQANQEASPEQILDSTLSQWVLTHYTSNTNPFRSETINSLNQALAIIESDSTVKLPRFVGIENGVYDAFTRLQIALDEARILCITKKGTFGSTQINLKIESFIKSSKSLHQQEYSLYSGQPLMITQNYRDLNLYNGDTGVIVRDSEGFKFSIFRGEGFEVIPIHLLPEYQTAYAMTVHKSQGSEFENVLLVTPPEDHKLMSREILYTAVTRAKYFVGIIGDPQIISQSVNRKIVRDSGLKDYFESQKKEEL